MLLPDSHRPEVLARLYAVAERVSADRDDRSGQELHGAFGHVARYREYLEIIEQNWLQAGAPVREEMDRRIQAALEEAKDGPVNRPVTEEELEAMELSRRLHLRVHLEVETFYGFASVMLDRVALLLRKVFGPAPKVKLTSHTKLVANLRRFAKHHGLTDPTELLDAASSLEHIEVAFRDRITHEINPRVHYASGVSPSGEVTINPMVIYPGEGDATVPASGKPSEMLVKIDAYVGLVLDYIEANTDGRPA